MSFEFTVEDVPTEDYEGTEKVTFVLKDVADIPVGILRRNRRNQESQMWAVFEWGVSDDQIGQFDRLTATQVAEMFVAWQESSNEPVDQDKPVGPPKAKKPTRE